MTNLPGPYDAEKQIRERDSRIRELEADLKSARSRTEAFENTAQQRLQNEIVERYFMQRDDLESKYFRPLISASWSGVNGEYFVMPRADSNPNGKFEYQRNSWVTMDEGWTPISFKEYEDARLRFFNRLLAAKKKRPTREELL